MSIFISEDMVMLEPSFARPFASMREGMAAEPSGCV